MVTAPPQQPTTGTRRRPWWRRSRPLPPALITLVSTSAAVPPCLALDPATAPIPIRPEPGWYYRLWNGGSSTGADHGAPGPARPAEPGLTR
ncbi:hypothetical protein [Nocardiopsis kunsanensis]|uniref:Uncharacterized protein n=1 Tax=Nocardiopsis kunsanensis TaxID=141693 RepID=A0A918XAR6_9ACTN|nr:hypothetical protein [Nocardiopsis kunsanensis]GHD20307.1 hypothetical protein GCM10007147_12310 [Nocardiopsis kunsanensis]